MIYIDAAYSPAHGLRHQDYAVDAISLDFSIPFVDLKVLSAVDLAVSKVGRLGANDLEDIRSLVRAGLTTPDEIEARAKCAMVA